MLRKKSSFFESSPFRSIKHQNPSCSSSMKSLSRFANSIFCFRQPLRRPFSSSSSSSSIKVFTDRCRSDAIVDSPVYLQSLLRRPPMIKPENQLRNSCSFIGTVIRPVKKYAGDSPKLGVYTVLEVKSPSRDSDQSSSFRILLEMWEELSEISLRHLKLDDYIYVYGSVRSYEKVDARGKREIHYKVVVSDLNFVKPNHTNQKIIQKPESAGAELTPATSYAGGFGKGRVPSCVLDYEEKCRDNLRLWQVFFANPHEWWDNRKTKWNSRRPDFKHKDTKECLWLKRDDPPWVSKQLELYDSRMGMLPYRRSNAFGWKVEDFD